MEGLIVASSLKFVVFIISCFLLSYFNRAREIDKACRESDRHDENSRGGELK
jgi:hypothetical protein